MKKYTEDFREGAVKLVTVQGYSKTEAARRIGIAVSTLQRWIAKFAEESPQDCEGMSAKELMDELKRLRKENKMLEMEREILKKAAACVLCKAA